jgi:type VI secretion system secreted protein VgrG
MSKRTFTSRLDIEGSDGLHLERFEIWEALSEGFRAEVSAVARATLDPDAMLGKPVTIELELEGEGPLRVFKGVLIDVSVMPLEHGFSRMWGVVAPKLELCKLSSRTRGFPKQTVEDVVTAVLAEVGAKTVGFKLAKPLPQVPFIAQVEESDFDFVRRLLDQDGITFTVGDKGDPEKVLFFDDSTKAALIPHDDLLFDRDSTELDQNVVWEVRQRRSSTSAAVSVRDYQPELSQLHTTAARMEGTTGREVYLHPGNCEESHGSRKANLALQRLCARTTVFEGKSNNPWFQPGHRFLIQGHRRAAVNVEQFLLSVVHRGSLEGDLEDGAQVYENGFVSIPAKRPFRPAITRASPVRGPQLALIAGPSSEDIHADEHGRVRVHFRWDRDGPHDDHSSTWMRVGQVPVDDTVLLPRKDFEVVVDFELGDPNRPIVTSRLYNGEWMPPYDLPAQKTRSSLQSDTTGGDGAGSNELLFEDTAGAELMHLVASRDLGYSVAQDASLSVIGNQKIDVGETRDVTVGTDVNVAVLLDRKLSVTGKQELTVNQGLTETVGYVAGPPDEKLTVGASRDRKVGGDDVEEVNGNLERIVGGTQRIIGIDGYQHQVTKDSTTKVKGLWMEVVGKSRTSTVGGDRKQLVGAAKLLKAESFTVMAGKALITTCMALKSVCSGNRNEKTKGVAAVTAVNKIKIKAKKILLTADSKLEFRIGGTTIKLDSTGGVSIKSTTVDLKGVKELGQVMHRSN